MQTPGGGIGMTRPTGPLVLAVSVVVVLIALGGAAAAQSADTGVGVDQTADETTVNVSFIGTVADEGTVTVGASGIVDDGGTPVDGVNATVTVGGQNATTATITDGNLTATFDPVVLSLPPTESATVGLVGYNVTDPAEVRVVHEAASLDEGYNLESVPQAAELVTENVSAVNVWDAANGTYDTVTDPVFDTDSNLNQGVYLTAANDGARLGYTFETTSTDAGTVDLATGWNFVSSNFDISTTANLTLAEDLDLVQGNVAELDVFPGDFEGGPLAPNDTVGAYDSYWVFVGADDQPVERNITDPAYDRDTRRAVLGVGEITLSDQVPGQTGTLDFVLAENVTAGPDDNIAITYVNDSGVRIVAGGIAVDERIEGGQPPVSLSDTRGFPGEHTVHVVAGDLDESDIGEPISDEIANTVTAQDSAVVYDAELNVTGQQFEDSTTEVVVDTSDLQPEAASDYQVIIHENTAGLPVLGNSTVVSGAQDNLTVTLDQEINATTDVLAMLHFPSPTEDFGPPIPAADLPGFGVVTDTATIEIQQAVNGTVEFQDQVLGTSNESPAVLAENVRAVDVATVDNAFDPQEDFLVLTEGTEVTGPNDVLDFVQLSELNESADVALNATGATPGQHTVVLHEPNDAGTAPDPDAPRTDASTGEVINATATVFDATLNITDQQYEDSTTQVTVDTSDLQPAAASDYQVIIHNNTAGLPVLGNSTVVSGAQDNLTVTLNEDINTTTDVLAMLHFPSSTSDFGAPIPVLDGSSFGVVTDTATVEVIASGRVNGTVTASGDTAGTNQAAGDPIAGANVTLYEGSSTAPADEVATTVTDQNGTYAFDQVASGNYTVEANATDFAVATAETAVAANSTSTVDFALDYAEPGAVSGEIVLNEGDPDETVNVTVEVVETGDNTTVTLTGAENATTYTIPDVDVNVGDGYTVTASEDTGNYDAPANATNVTVDVGATTAGVNFTFDRQTGGANGTVVASGDTASTQQTPGAGEGVENATIEVYAFQSNDTGTATFTFENATDASGAFDLPVDTFPVGDHFVVVDATNFSSAGLPVTITEGGNDLGELPLDYAEPGAVSGEIALDVSDPGEDVTVTVEVVETGDNTTVTLAGSSNTTTYTIPDVDVNVDSGYTVTASSDSGNYDAPANATNVTVDVGATTTGVDFGFTRQTGSLDGTVTNNNTGDPIDGAVVEVFGFGAGGPLVANTTTDVNGAYDVQSLPVGDHLVRVSVDGSVAANRTVTVSSNVTTTADFALNPANFAVTITDETGLAAAAGDVQSVGVTVENTGELPATQTVTLDWGDGAFTDSTSVTLGGGDQTVETLSITTATDQGLGTYNVTVTSEDDTDNATAAIGAVRSLNQTTVQPGGAVRVTVSGQLNRSAAVDLAEDWEPTADDSRIVSTSFLRDVQFSGGGDVIVRSDGSVSPGPVEIVYEIDIPTGDNGTVYEWVPEQDGDGSLVQLGNQVVSIFGDQSFEVTTQTAAETGLSSASRLPGGGQQPVVR